MNRLLFTAFAAYALHAPPVTAAELVMFEQRGCIWCQAWDREIGPAYANTDEGKRAPLRRVDIHQEIPEDLSQIKVERFTPTFVLVDDGEEIGRIRGYPGDEFFWFLLDEMLAGLDDKNEK
jgi:thioredoxin-related protein